MAFYSRSCFKSHLIFSYFVNMLLEDNIIRRLIFNKIYSKIINISHYINYKTGFINHLLALPSEFLNYSFPFWTFFWRTYIAYMISLILCHTPSKVQHKPHHCILSTFMKHEVKEKFAHPLSGMLTSFPRVVKKILGWRRLHESKGK